MFALGLLSWLYTRPISLTERFLTTKFGAKPDVLAANLAALRAGFHYGETTEDFAHRYEVGPAPMRTGHYRNITGNVALAYGLVTASHRAGRPLVLGSYPITPASDILHTLAGLKRFGVTTIQAEDEIAGVGAALGAAFGGAIGVTTTSGPGLALKAETIGLATSLELPLVVVRHPARRPSTGLPTKTEQADLLQAMFGRNGESPVAIVAPRSPADCFAIAIEAVRIATTYMTPVLILSDGYLANGSEPWSIPHGRRPAGAPTSSSRREPNGVDADGNDVFHPYLRDAETLARPWAVPGTPGLEHRIGGIEKANVTGNISYDPDNHDLMTRLRAAKIDGIAATVDPLEVEDPDGDAEVLVLGWGSTYGPIAAAARSLRAQGRPVAQAHLRHLNPFPTNTGDVLTRYRHVIVPEMNLGQLSMLLRARYLVDVQSHTSVRGLPFSAADLEDVDPEGGDGMTASTRTELVPTWVCRRSTGSRASPRFPTTRRRRPARTSPPTRRSAGAPAAATTRSWPPCRVSCPSSGCAARTSCSSPASAARRGSRTTSTPTACTRSTGARRRSPPGSRRRGRTSRSGSSRATVTRCRSAATTSSTRCGATSTSRSCCSTTRSTA